MGEKEMKDYQPNAKFKGYLDRKNVSIFFGEMRDGAEIRLSIPNHTIRKFAGLYLGMRHKETKRK